MVYVNLLIASSQEIVRSALTTLVSNAPDMTVVGQAQSTTDLLAQAKATGPDLVLVGWGLLIGSAADTIHTLQRLTPPPIVIVFGRQPKWSQEALAADADAFFWEGEGPKVLLTIIRKLSLGVKDA